VYYRLQPLGQNLFVRFASLASWVIDNRSEIDAARARFDTRSS
jgi:DNA-binding HxlR family transcriptional regulator